MKRYFPLLLISMFVMFSSCTFEIRNKSVVAPKEEKKARPRPQRLVAFIDDFTGQHPNWGNNDITIKETNEIFKKQLAVRLADDRFLFDYPVELQSIKKIGNQFYAEFASVFYAGNTIGFNVVGYFPKKYVETLVVNNNYRLRGKFKRFITDNYSNYASLVFTETIGMEKETVVYGKYTYGCGVILMDIEEIIEAK